MINNLRYIFRAYDKSLGAIIDHRQLMMEKTPKRKDRYYDIFADARYNVMMSTNFHDSKGVEIFEGDILRTEYISSKKALYEVIRDVDTGILLCRAFLAGNYSSVDMVGLDLNYIPIYKIVKDASIVVGNIYQHKSLMYNKIREGGYDEK